jgi:hypothetical protein
VQGLRHGLLPALPPEEHVQGLRRGALPARAPGALQGMLNIAYLPPTRLGSGPWSVKGTREHARRCPLSLGFWG